MRGDLRTRLVRLIRAWAAVLFGSAVVAVMGCGSSSTQTTESTPPQMSAADSAALDRLYDDVKPTGTEQGSGSNQALATNTAGQPDVANSLKMGTAKSDLKNPGAAFVDPSKMMPGKSSPLMGNPLASTKLTKPLLVATPRKVEVLIKEHEFASAGDGVLRVLYEDLDLLRVLNMEPVTVDCDKKMPQWLKQLSGKRVRMRGFMAQTFLQSELSNFIMARDTQACCFGPNTKIYHLIEVQLKPGLTTEYQPFGAIEVEGTFRIESVAEDDMMLHLYFITDAEIIKKK